MDLKTVIFHNLVTKHTFVSKAFSFSLKAHKLLYSSMMLFQKQESFFIFSFRVFFESKNDLNQIKSSKLRFEKGERKADSLQKSKRQAGNKSSVVDFRSGLVQA